MKTWKIISITLAAVLVISITSVVATLTYLNLTQTPQTPYNFYMAPSTATDSGYQKSTHMENMPEIPYSNDDPTDPNLADETSEQISSEALQLSDEELPVLYTPQFTTPQYSGYGFGGGCMGRGYYDSTLYPNTQTTSLTINQAVQIAQLYVNSLNNPDLIVEEVEEFTANFYVLVKEKSTGFGAFELLLDKTTGTVTPEMGPNMMWNTKYTFHSGYCNWFRGQPTTTPTITGEQAEALAQQYLDIYYQGTTADEGTAFYGYYTFEVLRNLEIYGMLSVNSYTGQVWFHTWHGVFIQEVTVA